MPNCFIKDEQIIVHDSLKKCVILKSNCLYTIKTSNKKKKNMSYSSQNIYSPLKKKKTKKSSVNVRY